MGALRTGIIVATLFLSAPLRAQAADDLPRVFANCAGQYSALVEHAWLVQDPALPEYELRRDAFLSLLDAVGGADDMGLNRRIDAKFALSALLRTASFSPDADRADAAADRVRAQVDACRLMLLGG